MSKKKPQTALANIIDQAKASSNFFDNNDKEDASKDRVPKPSSRLAVSAIPDVKDIKSEVSDSNISTFLLDHEDCSPWKFADRPEDEMGDILALAKSLATNGQQEPILVRRSKESGKYEIIFGNRRWRACKLLNKPVWAQVKSISDQEAAIYQKEENENRQDLSDLARAKSYKSQIAAGIFKNELEICKRLGISRSTFNDIMAFSRIPEELSNAVPGFKNISRKMASKLATISQDEKKYSALLTLAEKIGSKELNSTNIDQAVEKILSPCKKTINSDETIYAVDKKGKRIFTISSNYKGDVSVRINRRIYGEYDLSTLKKVIHEYLEPEDG